MTGPDGWKKLLCERNAVVWLAFLILVVAIGVGTLVFDRPVTPDHGRANYARSN